MLEGFAFKQTIGSKVTVEIRLPAITGMRAEEGIPVELKLNLPAALKTALMRANKQQEGFLMNNKTSIWKKDADGEFLSTTVFLANNH
ncbi:MAG: hypothetical protein ACR2MG_05910 [Pyrinomonadaceae bacterium]